MQNFKLDMAALQLRVGCRKFTSVAACIAIGPPKMFTKLESWWAKLNVPIAGGCELWGQDFAVSLVLAAYATHTVG